MVTQKGDNTISNCLTLYPK